VGFDKSDGLFEVFGTITGLQLVIDEISDLIAIGIVTTGPSSHGMDLYLRIDLIHRSFHMVSLFRMEFLHRRLGSGDASVEATVFGVGFLLNSVKCRGWDTAIGFGGFGRTLPMQLEQSSTRRMALLMAGRWQLLALMADSQVVFKISPLDKHRHAVRIWVFECV
jgi:hypothetical protein